MTILNIDKLSEFISLTTGTIYYYVSIGKIPYRKVGKRLLFVKEDIINWLDEHKHEVNNIYN